MIDKFESSDVKIGKSRKVSLLKNAGEIMHNREADYLANSHLSIGNSATKNESKIDASVIKKTMLLDTHRTTAVKDKHMCSIKPFEYKTNATQNTSQIKVPELNSNRSGKINREIVLENSVVKPITEESDKVQLIKDAIAEHDNKIVINKHNDSCTLMDDSIEQDANHEIVFEQKLIKEISYESPQKSSPDVEEWNYKLPTLKSSSGNDNLRNSNSEKTNTNGCHNENDSISVEFLEKSPEMTVFISEKDLSPSASNLKERSNLKNRFDQINNLRDSEEIKNFDHNDTISEKIVEGDESLECVEQDDYRLSSSTKMPQQEIIQKLNFLKEPDVNYNSLLNFQVVEPAKKDKAHVNEQANELTGFIWDGILDEIYSKMFEPRVIVPYLRQKALEESRIHDEVNHENPSETDRSELTGGSTEHISETTLESDQELC